MRVFAAGKVITGFHLFRLLALGADAANSARGMMFALGCIQARRCHANICPAGVATQDPALMKGLDVPLKSRRVARYHAETIRSFLDLLGSAGLRAPEDIRPHHVLHRVDASTVRHLGEIHAYLQPGALLGKPVAWRHADAWRAATANRWTAGR